MSWFSSAVSIDDQVNRATSESLPTNEQDLALNLEISDLIRSKTVQPKDAMRSLKRRLLHPNPNVKIATLHLVDTCIKNGGSHFLVEIASREFMDTIVLTLKDKAVNSDVKNLILTDLQNWSNAFQGQMQLSYVGEVYNKLKTEGFKFPYASKINSSYIDSSAPPEWVDSDTCMKCGESFTFVNRKHHCRSCGGVFDNEHCSKYMPLPKYGINQPVRVCDDCYENSKSKHHVKPPTHTVQYTSSFNKTTDELDADLQRALQLSLNESQPSYVPPTAPSNPPPREDDEDELALKAAIEASLKDMESNSKQSNDSTTEPVKVQPTPAWELTNTEFDNVSLYSTLVEKLKTAPPGTILRETQLQELNEGVATLRPKLSRTLANVAGKYEQLVDMNTKLGMAIRLYDNMLEERLSNAYTRQRIPSYSDPRAPAGYYPGQQPSVTSPVASQKPFSPSLGPQSQPAYSYPQQASTPSYLPQPAYAPSPIVANQHPSQQQQQRQSVSEPPSQTSQQNVPYQTPVSPVNQYQQTSGAPEGYIQQQQPRPLSNQPQGIATSQPQPSAPYQPQPSAPYQPQPSSPVLQYQQSQTTVPSAPTMQAGHYAAAQQSGQYPSAPDQYSPSTSQSRQYDYPSAQQGLPQPSQNPSGLPQPGDRPTSPQPSQPSQPPQQPQQPQYASASPAPDQPVQYSSAPQHSAQQVSQSLQQPQYQPSSPYPSAPTHIPSAPQSELSTSQQHPTAPSSYQQPSYGPSSPHLSYTSSPPASAPPIQTTAAPPAPVMETYPRANVAEPEPTLIDL